MSLSRTEKSLRLLRWVDYTEAQKSDLESIAHSEKIPFDRIHHCLNRELLPQFQKSDEMSVLVLRVYDDKKKPSADTVQELTTKLILFLTPDKFVTVHRLPLKIFNSFSEPTRLQAMETAEFLSQLIHACLVSYEQPIFELIQKAEKFEESLFKSKRKSPSLKEGYYLKRRASAYRRILKLTADTLNKMSHHKDFQSIDFLDFKETLDRLIFHVEEIFENATGLLNLQLSLSSHQTNEASFRTNEIMRIMTVFSIFFLPLNFIASIYGMNFENMPELKTENGYHWVLFSMFIVALLLFRWVHKKGWTRGVDDNPN